MSLRAPQKRGRPAGGSAGLEDTRQIKDCATCSLHRALRRFNIAFDLLEAVLRRLDQRLAAAAFRREAP